MRKTGIFRDLTGVILLAFVLQAFWAWRLQHPTYFDAYYYTTNAQRLAGGLGFTEEIIWQYLDDPAGLPKPSFTYWMPLPSLVAAVGYRLTGTFRGAQFPFWLMAGLLPVMAYVIGWRLTGERWVARTGALFTAFGGYYTAYWVQPSTFVLFAWVGGGCLLALAWALERKTAVFWFVAGLLAGLAHLARADGLLLLVIGGGLWLWQWREEQFQRANLRWRHLLALLGGYLLIMGGWFWHLWRVTGRPFPAGGAETIFLTTYNDVFAYGRHANLTSYLAWGWENILLSKLKAVWLAIQTFIAVTGLTVYTFFMVWAWVTFARREETRQFIRPFTWYTLSLYALMSLVFTFPGQRGSLLHSSTALWPWSMALAAAGLGQVVDFIASRRPHWDPPRAKRNFAALFLGIAFLLSFAVSLRQPLKEDEAAVFRQIGEILPENAVVMIGDPPAFHYHTGLQAVVVPNEPPEVLPEVARRYGVNYLVLNADRPPPLADLYEGKVSVPEIRPVQYLDNGFVLYAFVAEAGDERP
ncbi:MAG: hypothetical protein D6706_03095 [Chloroflexi bacterium]|nr:MAG: hypothetical protein D6706_03095 [Chloroflexota bacterium]